MRINLLLSVELGIVVSAKVMELITGENKINGNEDGMSDSHSSTILASVRNEARILSREERTLVFDSRFSDMVQ